MWGKNLTEDFRGFCLVPVWKAIAEEGTDCSELSEDSDSL